VESKTDEQSNIQIPDITQDQEIATSSSDHYELNIKIDNNIVNRNVLTEDVIALREQCNDLQMEKSVAVLYCIVLYCIYFKFHQIHIKV
jgi:hypothetical protein